jgi:hypothetical protein
MNTVAPLVIRESIDGYDYSVEEGDLVVIPRETQYQDNGDPTMGLLAISWPRFPGDKD